jgi:tRNA-binding protein
MGHDQAEAAPQITVDDFFRAEIRAGVVTRVETFPKARKPAYKLWIDFGDLGVKRSSAQITALYRPDELVGRTVLAVTNFPPRQVADFMSEVLVLGVPIDGTDEVVLLRPDRDVPPGARVS